jgi:hypothetical protein
MSVLTRSIKKRFNYKLGYDIIKKNNMSLSQDYSNIKFNRHSVRNRNSNCYREKFDNFTGITREKDILSKINNTTKNSYIIKDNSTGMYDYLTCLKAGVVEKKSKYTNMTVREFDYCMYSEFEMCMYSRYEFCIYCQYAKEENKDNDKDKKI